MKTTLFSCILLSYCLCTARVSATLPMPELLIVQRDTLTLCSAPLETLPGIDTIRPHLFGSRTGCNTTSCGRSYQAVWKIIGRQLYLTEIHTVTYRTALKQTWHPFLVSGVW